MIIRGVHVKSKFNTAFMACVSLVASMLFGYILSFSKAGSNLAAGVLLPTGLLYVKLFFLLTVPMICLEIVTGTMGHLQMRTHAALRGRLWSFSTVNDFGAALLGTVAGLLVIFSGVPVFHAGKVNFAEPIMQTFFPGFILLSVMIGFAADKAGEAGEDARRLFTSLASVFSFAGGLLLKYLPVGVFLLVCPVVAKHGIGVMRLPFKLMLLTVVCCLVYGFLICGYYLLRCGKDCPRHFFSHFKQVLLQSFSDSYSKEFEENAVRSLQRMGISLKEGQEEFDFGRLFGNTGTVLYCAIACMAVMQYSGMELTLRHIIQVLLWIMIFIQTNPDFPGAGLFCTLAVIIVCGLQPEAATLLVICEWLLDGVRSVVDVAFAGTGAYLADKMNWTKE